MSHMSHHASSDVVAPSPFSPSSLRSSKCDTAGTSPERVTSHLLIPLRVSLDLSFQPLGMTSSDLPLSINKVTSREAHQTLHWKFFHLGRGHPPLILSVGDHPLLLVLSYLAEKSDHSHLALERNELFDCSPSCWIIIFELTSFYFINIKANIIY